MKNRWDAIQEVVGRSNSKHKQSVTIVAVSKKQPLEKIQEAYEIGIKDFGENYVQEALPKIEALQKLDLHWHFIGSLQTNKMNKIVPVVHFLHAIDQPSQIQKLHQLQERGVQIPKLLVQVNLAKEETKSGLDEQEIKSFLENISQTTKLQVQGLMTFPPLQTDPEKSRPYFAKLYQWKETINAWKLNRINIHDLSMGVSSDYRVAVEEGATLIRVGEVLFGPRS